MIKPNIILDMDAVLVNLVASVIQEHNADFDDDFDWKNIKTWDWSETGKSRNYFNHVMERRYVFYDAEPTEKIDYNGLSKRPKLVPYHKMYDSINFTKDLLKEGYKITIATTPWWTSNYCIDEKRQWVNCWLPELTRGMVFTEDKSILATPNTILLDDSDKHLDAFDKRGGIAIGYKQGWTTYDKRCVESFEEFYNLVHKITDDLNSSW